MKKAVKKVTKENKPKSYDIVKDDKLVRKVLLERIKELTPDIGGFRLRKDHEKSLTASQVVADARKRHCKITLTSYNRFVNHGNIVNSLTQAHILWLCTRYGIKVNLSVGVPTIGKNDKGEKVLKHTILPYDEAKCLKKLSSINQLINK